MTAVTKIVLMMYDPAMIALDTRETATLDATLIAYELNARIVYIVKDIVVGVEK
jgi:hypothetical protein